MNDEVEKYVEFLLTEGCETPIAQKRVMFIRAAKLLIELNIKANKPSTINLENWHWPPNTNQEPDTIPFTWPPSITCVNDKNNVQLSTTTNVSTES